MRIAKNLRSYRVEADHVILQTNAFPIKIQFLTDNVVRIRTGFDGFTEASYSLVTTAWDDAYDQILGKERTRIQAYPLSVKETEESVIITCVKSQSETPDGFRCEVDKTPFRIRVYDWQGQCVHSDVVDLSYREDQNKRRCHTSEINATDCFYGFGEKGGHLNKAQRFLTMSPKDAMGYDPEKTDSLYKHIPFYIKLNPETAGAVGYFYHNTWECDFNLGVEKSNYWHRYSTYRANGGEIDLFLILGPHIRQVVQRYCGLVGTSAMLPRRALGYLGSSMYYPELSQDCDEAIESFVQTCGEYGIKISGFQLSSGYTQQATSEGLKRCVFTWNHDRFPDPQRFFERMEQAGVTVSPNVKPGILHSHPEYEQFVNDGMFIREADSEKPVTGTWWGGTGSFVDFTDPNTRKRWRELLTERVLNYGTASVWNDNCEYDSIVDLDARCVGDGVSASVGQLKSVMSNLMCREANLAINEKYPDKRPFVVCRSGHTGIQRYAQTWAGDNLTAWDTLKYNIATILGMGMCGVANQGADIGGFYGPAPEPELLVRWVQNGIFQPRFSIHSVNIDNTVTEPWMYPQVTKLIVEAMNYRQAMLPYLYSLMRRAHLTGLPIMEAMCSAFQNDPNTYQEGIDFMLGDLLVANVVEAGATEREVYLPAGHNFYHLPSGTYYRGGQHITVPVDLTSIPIFLVSGGIFCLDAQPNTVSGNSANDGGDCGRTLQIVCAPEADGAFDLYQDDGVSRAYEQGKYLNTRIEMVAGTLTQICFTTEGDFIDQYDRYDLQLMYRHKAPFFVHLEGQELEHFLDPSAYHQASQGWLYDLETRSVRIKYPNPKTSHSLTVSFEQFDMIGM